MSTYRQHHTTTRPKVWTPTVVLVFVVLFVVLPCLSHLF